MEEAYNLFFYANACHVCKAFGNEIILKRCGGCKMISYCNKDHQKQHWPQHKHLCQLICKVRANNIWHVTCGEQNISIEKWVRKKMNLMLLVIIQIGRTLQPYEEQMFKFPRACIICHDSETIENCKNCPNANFCERHKNDPSHEQICSLFQLCYSLDVSSIKFVHKIPKIIIPMNEIKGHIPDNIETFIDNYCKEFKISFMSSKEVIAYVSEYLTRPLTLLYALEQLKYLKSNNITVHVVGASMIEVIGYELWEILLHWLSDLISFKLVLVGPELLWNTLTLDLCKYCRTKRKTLTIEICGALYEGYEGTKQFTKPDILIGFNTGIHECEDFQSIYDTWVSSVKLLAKQNCPLILTSYTYEEAQKDHTRLKEILNKDIFYMYCLKNPYSSLRPYRDFESEGIFYQNQYMIIYERL